MSSARCSPASGIARQRVRRALEARHRAGVQRRRDQPTSPTSQEHAGRERLVGLRRRRRRATHLRADQPLVRARQGPSEPASRADARVPHGRHAADAYYQSRLGSLRQRVPEHFRSACPARSVAGGADRTRVSPTAAIDGNFRAGIRHLRSGAAVAVGRRRRQFAAGHRSPPTTAGGIVERQQFPVGVHDPALVGRTGERDVFSQLGYRARPTS